MIGIFVDELLVAGTPAPEITEVRDIMNRGYRLTDQSRLEYYLGVEVTQPDANASILHQADV